MKKRVYVIHGWEGHPANNWFPWLKKCLGKEGFDVFIPAMPDPIRPKKDEWVRFLKDLITEPDKDTYFVGHSMGCRTILRYLEGLPKDIKVGGAVLVAGWVSLPMWNGRTEEQTRIIEDWVNPPMDFEKVLIHTDKFVAIYSKDDPYFLPENATIYEEKLGAKLISKDGFGHFSDEDKVLELPEALNAIIEISK
jgi:uncharacterized protein